MCDKYQIFTFFKLNVPHFLTNLDSMHMFMEEVWSIKIECKREKLFHRVQFGDLKLSNIQLWS